MGQVVEPSRPSSRLLSEDIQRLVSSQQVLKLRRPKYDLIGPITIKIGAKPLVLFVQRKPSMPFQRDFRLPVLLGSLVLLTLVFSIVFARSLVKPISLLRDSSRQLAAGQWDTRVDIQQFRQDELGELAVAFNHMAEQVSASWTRQQRLFADVSHELRSPLTRLNMAVALAEQAAENDKVVVTALQRIESETANMDRLIGQVLRLARNEAGLEPFHTLPIDELLSGILENGRFEAEQRQIQYVVSGLPNQQVTVQVAALQSACENILRNALAHANSRVDVSVSVKNESWQVLVEDDGPGIAPDHLAQLFTPFYRAEKNADASYQGMGLGLAIAKAAVSAHHGSIDATNRHQGGLKVALSLPNTPPAVNNYAANMDPASRRPAS
jgi:two-component system sensor histidine kinase CpxA